MDWPLSDAETRLGELVALAVDEGPQTISRQSDRVVVLSEQTYQMLMQRKPTLKEFLLSGPSLEGLDLDRDKSPMREIEL